ncbi:MAG: carboxypeptidase regulatory-like domain-containing protein [SAR202 cluster bacterium]|nr:carboxypeptidase regulatory-like domain-containing protein [SAR202 cluster bacterium]
MCPTFADGLHWAQAWQRSHRRRWAWMGTVLTISLTVAVIGARVGAWDRAIDYAQSTSWFGVQAAARLASDLWEPGPSALPVDASDTPQISPEAAAKSQQIDGQIQSSPQGLLTAANAAQSALDSGIDPTQSNLGNVQPAQIVSTDELAALQGPLFDCVASVVGVSRASSMLLNGLGPSGADQDAIQDTCRDQLAQTGLIQNDSPVANRDSFISFEPRDGEADEAPVPVARIVEVQRIEIDDSVPSAGVSDVLASGGETELATDPAFNAGATVVDTAYDGSAIHVTANIDGKSQLVMRGSEAWWLHKELSAPGRSASTDLATRFNDEKWLPEWPDQPDAQNYDCQCESSMYDRLTPPFPAGYAEVRIEALDARGDVAGTINLTDEGYMLVVEFDDTESEGSDWYEILVFAEETTPSPLTLTAPGSGMVRGATIRGVVTDASTGAPIADVGVSAGLVEGDHTAWADTGSDGAFALTGLPAGLVDMNFNSDLYIDSYATIQIEALDSVINVNYTLDRGGAITGRVTDAETGLPIAHAWVESYADNGDGGANADIDAGGWYTLAGLAPGKYRVKAYGDEQGYVLRYFDNAADWRRAELVNVGDSETAKDIDFSLEKGAALIGQITDSETGLPIEDVDLSAGPNDGEHVSWASTGRDGKYILPGLPVGLIDVEIRSRRHIDQWQTLALDKAGATLSATSS